MRVFLLATPGHGSAVLQDMRGDVIGICSTAPKRLTLRARIGRLRSDFRDPFERDAHPFTLTRAPRFLSSDLEAVAAFLERERPELILCCGFPRRLPARIIDAAAYATVNVHAGLLPERGGGTPTRWAIREGDPEIGVTAHLMTEQFDAGDIVWRRSVPLPPDAHQGAAEALLRPLVREAARFVLDAAKAATPLPRWPQTVRMQKSYRGEPMDGRNIELAACRALLPKACPYGRRECRKAKNRPCKIRAGRGASAS